ncbi:4-hydroxyphenylacetate 3-monooxygenase, reductase component [Conservatibacter flavescens]|uniref:4-hydroxyphenylacetate 3-monooxygenase reductase component n=1 Tax=Conservatibacter flavescens TaxID=28161 RepID=A0A2M8S1Q0_9PAST|nr:4-hydroxyphenylacetate 3-monooxygenase, reductase component [Conservatibacter flavescens]PJG85089.1 4-hydroxyphenylacetate 3-monooxygenase, reductase component [Conservatibacter flavescens]
MLSPVQQQFRNAMSKLAAAVNIITTDGEAGKCGITATAVCSITDTPPTLMVCINQNSEMNAVFQQNKRLCVNILTSEQEELACHFAGFKGSSMEERFAWDIWQPNEEQSAVPMLKEALANLKGTIVDIRNVGTHSLFLVELEHIAVAEEGQGLVYFNRHFHHIGSTP